LFALHSIIITVFEVKICFPGLAGICGTFAMLSHFIRAGLQKGISRMLAGITLQCKTNGKYFIEKLDESPPDSNIPLAFED